MEGQTNVTARFAGRRTYEIIIKQGERKVRRIVYIPLINSSIRFMKELYKISEELCLNDYNVTVYELYGAIRKEAYEIRDTIPNLYDYLYDDLYY